MMKQWSFTEASGEQAGVKLFVPYALRPTPYVEVETLLSGLAACGRVSSNTQNQAAPALL